MYCYLLRALGKNDQNMGVIFIWLDMRVCI